MGWHPWPYKQEATHWYSLESARKLQEVDLATWQLLQGHQSVVEFTGNNERWPVNDPGWYKLLFWSGIYLSLSGLFILILKISKKSGVLAPLNLLDSVICFINSSWRRFQPETTLVCLSVVDPTKRMLSKRATSRLFQKAAKALPAGTIVTSRRALGALEEKLGHPLGMPCWGH